MSRTRRLVPGLASYTYKIRQGASTPYDFEQDAFQGLPRSLRKQVEGDPGVAGAISKARRFLNVPEP